MTEDLQLALELADMADELTMHSYRSSSLVVRAKSDATPVTEADEAVERAIRERLEVARPGDGVVGEEYGSSGAGARRWIIDPIDGTKNYARGIPVFATLIALEVDAKIVAGVVSAPALHRRWWASAGGGASSNEGRLAVSQVATLQEAHLAYTSYIEFETCGVGEAFGALVSRCSRARGFGDFWSHMLVAEGAMEIAIEPQVAAWDMAAVQIIVEEAGGRFTDLRGRPRFDAGSAVSTNGALHQHVLEFFR